MDMLFLGDLEMGELEIIFEERRQVLMAAIPNRRRKGYTRWYVKMTEFCYSISLI